MEKPKRAKRFNELQQIVISTFAALLGEPFLEVRRDVNAVLFEPKMCVVYKGETFFPVIVGLRISGFTTFPESIRPDLSSPPSTPGSVNFF